MVSAGGDGKGTAMMDCWERMRIITGSTGNVIGSKCIMCEGSKTAEGKQRQHTAGTRGVQAKWAWQSTILSDHQGLGHTARLAPAPVVMPATAEQQKRPAERTRGPHMRQGRAAAAHIDCETKEMITKKCVLVQRPRHLQKFAPDGGSTGTCIEGATPIPIS